MARDMMRLQEVGCHNINFVTPTHYAPQIVASLPEAIEMGLRLPIVYNCSGYESIEVIRLLGRDCGYLHARCEIHGREIFKTFLECSGLSGGGQESSQGDAPPGWGSHDQFQRDCRERASDQAPGDAGGVASSEAVLKFIAEEISVHSYVNIMDQYRPEYRAHEYAEINRRITHKEYLEAIQFAKSFRLYRGF